jgi:hypothetical protein
VVGRSTDCRGRGSATKGGHGGGRGDSEPAQWPECLEGGTRKMRICEFAYICPQTSHSIPVSVTPSHPCPLLPCPAPFRAPSPSCHPSSPHRDSVIAALASPSHDFHRPRLSAAAVQFQRSFLILIAGQSDLLPEPTAQCPCRHFSGFRPI